MGIRMKITKHNLTEEQQRAADFRRVHKSVLFKELEDTSLELMGMIRVLMPKKTGRAFRSWGSDIWEEDESNLSIKQGSNVHYIKYLNEGSSQQAPAGFIDGAVEAAVDDLIERLLNTAERKL